MEKSFHQNRMAQPMSLHLDILDTILNLTARWNEHTTVLSISDGTPLKS
jgi:hypothetical protein